MPIRITKIKNDSLGVKFSLLLNRLPGRLDQVHARTAAQLLVNNARMASDVVAVVASAILIWIRELPGIRQDNLAVCSRLGDITPPSVRCVYTAVITCWETMLHSSGHDRPMLVLTSSGLAQASWLYVSQERVHVGSLPLVVT